MLMGVSSPDEHPTAVTIKGLFRSNGSFSSDTVTSSRSMTPSPPPDTMPVRGTHSNDGAVDDVAVAVVDPISHISKIGQQRRNLNAGGLIVVIIIVLLDAGMNGRQQKNKRIPHAAVSVGGTTTLYYSRERGVLLRLLQ